MGSETDFLKTQVMAALVAGGGALFSLDILAWDVEDVVRRDVDHGDLLAAIEQLIEEGTVRREVMDGVSLYEATDRQPRTAERFWN